jgi:uncharacterized protein
MSSCARRAALALWLTLLLYVPRSLAAEAAGPSLPADLPPITQSAGEHLRGKVIWHDLVTPDLEAAKRFYSALFGWTFRDIGSDYSVAYSEGEAVGGIFQRPLPAGGQRQPLWLSFIAVSDVGNAAHTAEHNGAKVLAGPRSHPNRGEQAVLSDPEGAMFGVLASSSGDPPDYLANPGAWIWSAVLVRDPDREATFYQKLFDYEVFDLSEGEPLQVVLSSQDYARATIRPLAPGASGRARWLGFVRVEDAASAASKAQSLGARLLVEPRTDRHGGRLAVIADPGGAPLGLMEWNASGTQSAQVPK